MLHRFIALIVLCLAIGCGGGSSNTPPPTPPPAPPSVPPSSGAVNPPTTVTVAAGATVGGNDVTVPAPAKSPAENAQVLGTSAVSGGSATSTGSTIHRGETKTVLLFGPGLDGSMQVTITGPADIVVSNIQSIQSTKNVPGIAFTAAVSSDAALGARTVILQATNEDITTFAGGLEVVP